MAGILGIEYILPDAELTNDELAADYKTWSANKILDKTGIEKRHVVKGETAVDLGVSAAEKLFESGVVKREEVEFVLLVTQSPDYILPTSACIIQDRLGLNKRIGAFDINLGCSGFIYGLAVAGSMVDSGLVSNVLLITAETYTKHINKLDKSTRTIFGDGAAATLVGRGGLRLGSFDFGTDGSGKELLMIPAGGARIECSEDTSKVKEQDGNMRSLENLFMDGTGVFEFTIREVPESVNRLLEKEQIRAEDVDLYVFHQANKFMLDFLRKTMKIEEDKFYVNMSDIGNTVSASIPIALKRAITEGRIRNNSKILLSGFGVGLSWGSTIIYMEEEE